MSVEEEGTSPPASPPASAPASAPTSSNEPHDTGFQQIALCIREATLISNLPVGTRSTTSWPTARQSAKKDSTPKEAMRATKPNATKNLDKLTEPSELLRAHTSKHTEPPASLCLALIRLIRLPDSILPCPAVPDQSLGDALFPKNTTEQKKIKKKSMYIFIKRI